MAKAVIDSLLTQGETIQQICDMALITIRYVYVCQKCSHRFKEFIVGTILFLQQEVAQTSDQTRNSTVDQLCEALSLYTMRQLYELYQQGRLLHDVL